MRILVKAAVHRRWGMALTNIPIEMDKWSSTKQAISEYRNSDFLISGFVISSRKNIQINSRSTHMASGCSLWHFLQCCIREHLLLLPLWNQWCARNVFLHKRTWCCVLHHCYPVEGADLPGIFEDSMISTSCGVIREKCDAHFSHSTHHYLRFGRFREVDGLFTIYGYNKDTRKWRAWNWVRIKRHWAVKENLPVFLLVSMLFGSEHLHVWKDIQKWKNRIMVLSPIEGVYIQYE